MQKKLREELLTVQTDSPTMDELSALPYLDAVVRETMRVHAPVPSTIRIAVRDDAIPLNTPYVDVHGQVHDAVRVAKGTPIFIPILALNRSKALWGEDAHEWKPERWLAALPGSVQDAKIPGVYSNLYVLPASWWKQRLTTHTDRMTFLGGGRACM